MTTIAANRRELWEPGRVTNLAQARRRSTIVGILRMVFTVGAAVSAGVLFGHLISHTIASFNDPEPPPTNGVTMINPRFNGRDASNQPYVITAATARQRRGDKQAVDLDSPVLEDAMGTVVSAAIGVFDRQAQTLQLTGDVELLDANGYQFTSESATMHVQDNRIEGDTPLTGGGPLGEVRANSYSVVDGGSRIILTGKVWTRIVPQDAEQPATGGSLDAGLEAGEDQ